PVDVAAVGKGFLVALPDPVDDRRMAGIAWRAMVKLAAEVDDFQRSAPRVSFPGRGAAFFMPLREKPGWYHTPCSVTAPALQRTAPQELRHSASKTRVNA